MSSTKIGALTDPKSNCVVFLTHDLLRSFSLLGLDEYALSSSYTFVVGICEID